MEMNNDKTQDWIKPATKSDQEESLSEKEENLYNQQEEKVKITQEILLSFDEKHQAIEKTELNQDMILYKKRNKKEYITAPIYYVNGEPHIGHLYSSFAVDILARFNRLLSKNVFTSFGTDEHGQKIQTAAKEHKPQEYVDKMHLKFKSLLKSAKIETSCFIRTTDDLHKKTATYFWERLVSSGLTYEGTYSGWYSERDESYYKENEVEDGRAKETGSPVEFLTEECVFFRLSYMKEVLLEYYEQNPDVIKPKSRYTEIVNMIKSDLPDLAISRSRFSWGIKVPGSEDKIMYVWVDALSNYLSSIGYPRNTKYNEWWSTVTHIIGKDILKFHAIYWPAMLMAADLQPPNRIFAHGWWTIEGEKMSKSVGNVVDPFVLIDRYGPDSLRYYMFRESTFGNDCNFSIDSLHQSINSELSNELGNLIQRVLAFCSKKFGSSIECPIKAHYSKNHSYSLNSDKEHKIENKDNIEEKSVETEKDKKCNWKMDCDSIIKIISKLEYRHLQEKLLETNSANSAIKEENSDNLHKANSTNAIALVAPSNETFGNTVKKYWNRFYTFFNRENQNKNKSQIEEKKVLNEEKIKKCMDFELSVEILKEWDTALLESALFIEEQKISAYVNRFREAIVKTNRYIDLESPWKHEDPTEVLGVLCLCVQRLALLGQPIIPEKSQEILSLLGIDGSLKHWLRNKSFPIYNPKPIFEKI